VTIDEPCCGAGAARSAARLLNVSYLTKSMGSGAGRKRRRASDEDSAGGVGALRRQFQIVCALDADVRSKPKTALYNATARSGEVHAQSMKIESPEAMSAVDSLPRVLITVCGLPCNNLSRMGDQQGAKTGTSIDVFLGFFARLARTRSLLLIIEEVDALLHATNAASFRYVVAKLEAPGYHWRVRVLDSAKLGAAQQRRRAYIVASLFPAVIAAFLWPKTQHKGARFNARAGVARAGHAPAFPCSNWLLVGVQNGLANI